MKKYDRVVLFHFHLFKNAGTAIDKILHENFEEKFVTREFKFWPYHQNIKEVISWIEEDEEAIAFSSHTARLFNPEFLERKGIKLIPILFVRHPIVRIHSAYHYERKQKDINRPGPVIARNTNFKGYVEIRWAIKHQEFTCRNFHVFRLADMFRNSEGNDYSKALKALEKLPFVGLVEDFEKSVKRLESIVREYYPSFKTKVVKANVQFDPNDSLDNRLKMVEKEVGPDFYKELLEANKKDILLWEKIKKFYDKIDVYNNIYIKKGGGGKE